MSEAELQKAVIECARLLGWRVAHFRPARTEKGWRTPVEADGQGFPDLIMVRGPRFLFAELKSDKGRVSPEQQEWNDALARVASSLRAGDPGSGFDGFIWRPADWSSGEIEEALR